MLLAGRLFATAHRGGKLKNAKSKSESHFLGHDAAARDKVGGGKRDDGEGSDEFGEKKGEKCRHVLHGN